MTIYNKNYNLLGKEVWVIVQDKAFIFENVQFDKICKFQ